MAQAAGDPAYLLELKEAARAAQLSDHPYWHKLLHYRRNRLWPGWTSAVDAPPFFLAADGKTDPAAELDASLVSFFSDEPRLDEPPQCRVKARYEWLKSKLRFEPTRLPPQTCSFYEKWAAAVNPAHVALVFAANDLNSPATMYGHTLLRVDPEGQAPDQPLLSHAVSYAAAVAADGNQVGFIFQALIGGFAGEYSIYRYHERVRQYVRVNHRDLWEYPVRLTRPEMIRMFWHLWEMRAIGSDYLFFTENCSYLLLALLETAREDLVLLDEFDGDPIPFVIPVDTLRVARDAGLLEHPVFRPSLARTLAHKLAQLEPSAFDWVHDYADGEAGLDDARLVLASPETRARMLELANDYIYFRFQGDQLAREAAIPRSREALAARSRLDARSDFAAVPVPATMPDQGHLSSRLALGWRRDHQNSAAVIRARGAYHDRLDPPAGYLPGGEIEFFDLNLLVSDRLRVSDLKLVSVQSVTPWDRTFKPWLWQAAGGLRRFGLDALAARPRDEIGAYAQGGLGLATGESGGWLLYGFGIGSFDANRDVESGYAFSAGLRSGLALTWTPYFTQQLESDVLAAVAGGSEDQVQIRFGSQWQFSQQDGVRLLLNHVEFEGESRRSAEIRWQRYF